MPLLRLDKLSIAFGHRHLLSDASLTIHAGERIGLVGRNGEGKSTLLNIVAGRLVPDDGTVWVRPGVRVDLLDQDISDPGESTVFDTIADGLSAASELIRAYHQATRAVASDPTAAAVDRLARCQQQLEAAGGWAIEQRVETILSQLGLDADARLADLSGGWRRRTLLARALVGEPDLLLLDEPTNHLDIDTIEWLETLVAGFGGAVLFVSHDRAFTRRLATRIVELDRGQLKSWDCDYDSYLVRKSDALAEEERHARQFDRKLAEEERWIRQGIKARRTRNEGRVRALERMRAERRGRVERQGNVRMALAEADRSGQIVFEAEHAGVSLGGERIIDDFSVRILRGDRVGLVGPNGAGKTTLVRLLLGELAPDSGQVRRGTRLEVAYFDQLRATLDLDKSVMDNVAEGRQRVTVNGASVHVSGYLRGFLFPPERLDSPVSSLSGGERNRLLLARLFTQPANVLVMDEPTNDLDVETLELLESLVTEYEGTVLLVSHDRQFLDNVITSALVFEGGGHITEHVGDYSDWVRYRERRAAQQAAATKQREPARAADAPSPRPKPSAKLSYKDQRELDALPGQIEALETEQARLRETINSADFFQQPHDLTQPVLDRLTELDEELAAAYARWDVLESER